MPLVTLDNSISLQNIKRLRYFFKISKRISFGQRFGKFSGSFTTFIWKHTFYIYIFCILFSLLIFFSRLDPKWTEEIKKPTTTTAQIDFNSHCHFEEEKNFHKRLAQSLHCSNIFKKFLQIFYKILYWKKNQNYCKTLFLFNFVYSFFYLMHNKLLYCDLLFFDFN